MTDPAPDTQQIEMLKTLLHDSRTERTRLADEVDRLRARLTLTEDEQSTVMRIGEKHNWPGGYMQHDFADLLAIIDRLSPGVAEPPTPCRHSIYHSGCSSCDESDPESRPGHPWADRRAVDLGEKP